MFSRKLFKLFLMSLPKDFLIPDGNCPKCGFPLEAKKWKGKTYFICKNFKCGFYKRAELRQDF